MMNRFVCLNDHDVITAGISDHHPVIHDGALFWNIMMQGKMRKSKEGIGYNNGFGIVENDSQYMSRLVKIAQVIAEIVFQYPDIEIIGLCEGPIDSVHQQTFQQSLKAFTCMHRFFKKDTFYQPNVAGYPHWGLLMLTDSQNKVSEIRCDIMERSGVFFKLANRFQLWKIAVRGKNKYFALGHFPFGGDEYITEKSQLSTMGHVYSRLINQLIHRYADDHFIFCADFNFNPYLICQWQDRVMDKIENNNSIVFTVDEKHQQKTIQTVTVDGILLSQKEKQKYSLSKPNPDLFGKLVREFSLFKSTAEVFLQANRAYNSALQNEYDNRILG